MNRVHGLSSQEDQLAGGDYPFRLQCSRGLNENLSTLIWSLSGLTVNGMHVNKDPFGK